VKPRSRTAAAPAGTARERLIAAAGEVIAEEGYEGAGTQAIARRAGLTNGAIYANFRDKSELLAEAVEVYLSGIFGRMDEARRAGASAAQVLERVGRRRAVNTPERDRRLLIEALAAARRDPEVGLRVRELVAQFEAYQAGMIAEARAEGDIADDVDPATMARFSTALALGYHLLHCAGVTDPDRDHWVSLMTRVVGSLVHTSTQGGVVVENGGCNLAGDE
jgi:AcrR family transcriptional regulator